jgi:hypothetical protein
MALPWLLRSPPSVHSTPIPSGERAAGEHVCLLWQSLPAPVYTLMKSTEPWSDEFYGRNLVKMLTEEGFRDVEDVLTDARHSTVTGTAC